MQSASGMVRCIVCIALIGEEVNEYKTVVPKPTGRRPLGSRWEGMRLVSLCVYTLGRLAQVVAPLYLYLNGEKSHQGT
jgi:hypothetical protein